MIRNVKRGSIYTALLILLATLLSACGGIVGPTAQEMTLQARNGELSSQLDALRQTATVEMDRMMVTVEYSSTEVRAVAFQRDALRATLVARGTDPGFIDVTSPQSGNGLPPGIDTTSLLPTPAPGIAAAPAVTPPGAVAANPALSPDQLAAVTPTPVLDTNAPRLIDPVLATGVTNNDCAANNATTFPSTASEIYAVATAQNFPAGTTVSAIWAFEGIEQGRYDIPFDFAIQDACIWAFIDQSDFPFTPGNWTVQMLINGNPAVGPLSFTITGDAPADVMDDMTDGG
ncbi:MAG: hypothetical protein AAF125_07655 [Chloroflexota bacterium]